MWSTSNPPRALSYLALFAAVLIATPEEARSTSCDLPLIVQQSSAPPNVLIVLDTSASMNEPLYHPDYDDTVVWPGTFATTTYYYVSADGTYAPSDFRSSWPTSPKAPLITGDSGQRGYLLGNYANWIFYHATDEQRAALPQVCRMEVGKAAIRAVVEQAVGLRYGLMVFNGSTGGKLLAPLGSDRASLLSLIDSASGDGYTPTAETLVDAMEYFQSTGAGAPIQEDCQQSFVVLVTDGIPTKDLDVPSFIGDQDGDGNEPGSCASVYPFFPNSYDCSDYMDDVAYYMSHHDMRPDLDGDQTITTYTIGFAIDHPLIEDTARNGGGMYRVAWDLDQLVTGLGTVIGDIVNRVSAGAAVAVVSTEAGTGSHLYRGKFMPGLWKGFLEAYDLPYRDRERPVWEAGSILADRTPASRVLFTNLDGRQTEFRDAAAADLMTPLGAQTEAGAADIINYVRGASVPGTRDRHGWKLGDVVYSTPIVVGPPNQFVLEESYQDFLTANASRDPVLYIGANDGMLHAFDTHTGEEMWGYVPSGVLGNLKDLMASDYCHTAFVDLNPVAYDVKIGGSWRTVLFGGLRTGGDTYFALDVTRPASPRVLWETSLPSITSSFTEPAILRTQMYGTLLWSGSAPSSSGLAYAAAIQVDGGAPLFQLPIGNATADLNMLTGPTMFDSDYDGFVDLVYQADLDGNLWRFWIHDANGVWYYSQMFHCDEPIQTKPVVAIDEHNDIYVYFGTGRYLQGSDVDDTRPQRFYAVQDDGLYTMKTPADLVDQTASIQDTDGALGWYFDLTHAPGERVTEPATIVQGVVYFTSFAPSSEPCEAGGRSWLYGVDYSNGSAIDPQTEEPTDDVSERAVALGDGVSSRPVVNLADEELVIQTSDARLSVENLTISPRRLLVRAWREQFKDTTGTVDTENRDAQQ